ncbi:MAG: RHS repeat-associated core domain-containing protein, partial [Ktedonobacteraceae bacterium]|nr:RHS repeat-associated core domain-containing protein [Ktedonobacteraceae bacterium]
YPDEYRTLLPLAGYIYHQADGTIVEGFFAATEQRRYDFHDTADGSGRGLLMARRDPLGNTTTITYDSYALLPVSVTDPAGLVTTAMHDYRVLLPSRVTEPNGSQSLFSYTPLGLLSSTALMGKQGEGDTASTPGTRMVYDFQAYVQRGQPMSIRTIRRLYHSTDTRIPAAQRDLAIESITYSDGMGRLLQTRTQAEDIIFALNSPSMGDAGLPLDQAQNADAIGAIRPTSGLTNVVVSGWQTYDNKGRVVERYEPFFSSGWEYQPATDAQSGRKVTMLYDPRGQITRTINPDGSEQNIIYGVPQDITHPDLYTPTPWEVYTYDANDNAALTPNASGSAQVDAAHINTPTSVVKDALGRTVLIVNRASRDPHDRYIQRQSYDIRGNVAQIIDPLGRLAYQHVYDLANRRIRSQQQDGGTRLAVFDAAGNAIEQRDSKGALQLHVFDVLKRLSLVLARDSGQGAVTLRERIVYGDGGDPNQATADRQSQASANRLGRIYQHYDEAGLLTVAGYDFKGNVLQKSRQAIDDSALLAVFTQAASNGWVVPPFVVDWRIPPPLDTAHSSQADYAYDALNRIILLTGPADVAGQRHTLTPQYNNAGLLETLALDNTPYIQHIAYTAHGQRTLVVYGNGLMTRYAYHPQTARLLRLRTDTYTQTDPLSYHPGAIAYQDLLYSYDLVGNIMAVTDRAPGSGVRNNPESQSADSTLAQLLVSGDALVRHFSYDPLYRLTLATGRECQNIPAPRPWTDDPRCGYNVSTPTPDNAPDLTAIYQERYDYDPSGNLLSIRHEATDVAWTRAFGIGGMSMADWTQAWQAHLGMDWANAPGNQLTHSGTDGQTHFYDPCGNLIQETTSRYLNWDYANRLRSFAIQAGSAEPSQYTLYLYDSSGQRLKKLTRTQGGSYEVTVSFDGQFDYQYQGNGPATTSTIWLLDGSQRLARVRIGTPFADDASPAILYYLGDNLGSATLAVDDTGSWINREEYAPFGETLFGSFARRRYRFTGKERDAESGLCYHGARYYAPWLARWVSCDPAGTVDGLNLYVYVHNNPIKHIDNSGHSAAEKLADPELVETAKTVLRLIPGGLAAGGGATATGAGAGGAVAGGPVIVAVAAVITIGISGYMVYQLYKENKEVEQARQHAQETQKRLESAVGEAVQQKRMTPEQARLLLSNGLPSTTAITRASARNDSALQKAFMASALKTILNGCNGKPHPLAELVDAKTRDWKGRSHLDEDVPTNQAGHDVSKHSGLPSGLSLEDSFFNQLTNWTGEKRSVKAIFEKPSIDICGVRVELRTAQMYARILPEVNEWFKANNIPLPHGGLQDLSTKSITK